MKDTYLPHDLGARNDPKMLALQRAMGGQGKAIFWDLCEMLWENDGYLPADYETLAYGLRYCTADEVRQVVEGFDLFKTGDGHFWSDSALRRIQHKKDISAARVEAGKASGRARGSNNSSGAVEQPTNTPRTNVEQMLNTPRTINQLINKSSNKLISQSAGAGAPTREEEDFLLGKFFFRNFTEPEKETARCLDHYKDTGIKDREAVAKKWTPEKAQPRFDDARILPWVKKLWAIVSTSANPHEGAELLRHIDAATIDRSANELRVRMRGNSWGEAVAATVEINPPLKEGFDKVSVTKVRGS